MKHYRYALNSQAMQKSQNASAGKTPALVKQQCTKLITSHVLNFQTILRFFLILYHRIAPPYILPLPNLPRNPLPLLYIDIGATFSAPFPQLPEAIAQSVNRETVGLQTAHSSSGATAPSLYRANRVRRRVPLFRSDIDGIWQARVRGELVSVLGRSLLDEQSVVLLVLEVRAPDLGWPPLIRRLAGPVYLVVRKRPSLLPAAWGAEKNVVPVAMVPGWVVMVAGSGLAWQKVSSCSTVLQGYFFVSHSLASSLRPRSFSRPCLYYSAQAGLSRSQQRKISSQSRNQLPSRYRCRFVVMASAYGQARRDRFQARRGAVQAMTRQS